MTQLTDMPSGGNAKKAASKNPAIDMTPMVDLGFLLITFFIFTTTMTDPHITKLIMPKETGDSTNVPASKVISALLSEDDEVFVYSGLWEEAVRENRVLKTGYDVQKGLGSLIREKKAQLGTAGDKVIFLIKPMEAASYRNVVDGLDEATVNDVKRYAIVAPSEGEKEYIRKLAGSK